LPQQGGQQRAKTAQPRQGDHQDQVAPFVQPGQE
jgi:hypothetical protein